LTQFLAGLPIWLTGLLMVGVTTALAMVGSFEVRRRVGLERLVVNNEVAGFKFATVGVIYAVLMAFAVIVVWEKFSEGQRSVVHEAGAVATLYRLADVFGPEAGLGFKRDLAQYVDTVIHSDWPAMEQGKGSPATTAALDALYRQVIQRTPDHPQHGPVLIQVFRQLDDLTLARRERLHLSQGVVPGVIWATLAIGAAMTVVFTFFFGTRNPTAQVLMTGVLTAMTSLGLLVIVSIDHPFTGPVKITPHVLEVVLHDFSSRGAPPTNAPSEPHPASPGSAAAQPARH
jgi:Protein of unknown function (DUF4239)